MNFLPKLILGVALSALAACVSSQQDSSTRKPVETVPTETALNLFTDACLNTLPNFRKFESQVAKHGMQLVQGGLTRVYLHPENRELFATISRELELWACGVIFVGPADKHSISQQFLNKAMSKTGGTPQSKIPISRYEVVHHLQNGSFFFHEVKRKRGQTLHFIMITPPVPRDGAFAYVYK
ncbi:hypothetical protein NNA36_12150 [Shimia sp. CNT1-13L.2]|uniref:hypothetical protein n=1 Tax=Shimia sp. CNT1-13L.2 TaxID=2959663 RepID=UPI0020CF1D70|nr:hypothetical protein [Shimia sp. CNT1-13L.2]MCP9482713.1 hypothetical protein [Shimia sp. CNT1-13L.2]